MPIGYTKDPPLKTFVVAKIKKTLTEKQLTLYKQKYHTYFYQHDYLKLIKPDIDKDFVLMLFCFPEDLATMKEGFEVEEFIEIQLPGIAPIHKEQKQVYDQYWNIVHPSYDYPHRQYKEIENIMQSLIESKQTRNKCILFDETQKILIEAEDECHVNNIRHCVMVVLEKLAKQQVEEKQFKEIQYYAKDLILAVYFEPCIMCSMALIHSRIKEVYYYQKRVIEGGLNESLQINHMKQLNHKYLVFYQCQ